MHLLNEISLDKGSYPSFFFNFTEVKKTNDTFPFERISRANGLYFINFLKIK